MEVHRPFIVFTDLDGTLLDHHSYDWTPARPALEALAAIGAPVILASSKTAAEILPLQDALGLSGLPAIVENGAGVLGLNETGEADGAAYARIRATLADLPAELRDKFTGFGDLTAAQVSSLTGLSEPAAEQAKKRHFSEPGQWLGSALDQATFLRTLADQGVYAKQGGRFLTLSLGHTKADRMDEICAHLGSTRTVALGDAPNDIEMLDHAGIGVVIANPHRAALPPLRDEASGRILRPQAPGPVGWNSAMFEVMDRMKEELRHSTDG